MMLRLGSGGSVTELSVTGRYRSGTVMAQHAAFLIPPPLNIAQLRKVNLWGAKLANEAAGSSPLFILGNDQLNSAKEHLVLGFD